MKSYILLLSIVLLVAQCGTRQANPGDEEKEKKSSMELLLDEVVAGHDVAMAKMNKLSRMQQQTQKAIDSVSLLSGAAKKAAAAYARQLDTLLKALDYADFAMNQWMQEFKYDSLADKEAQRIQYLQSEKDKVNKMKEAVLSSLHKADQLFEKSK